MVREADGYQPHLVSPEYGLQRLVDETLALTLEPVSTCVRRVHQVLLDAARHAPFYLPQHFGDSAKCLLAGSRGCSHASMR